MQIVALIWRFVSFGANKFLFSTSMQKKRFFITTVLLLLVLLGAAQNQNKPELFFEKAYVGFRHGEYKKALENFERFIQLEYQSKKPRIEKIAKMHQYRAKCFENLDLLNQSVYESQVALGIYKELNDTASIISCFHAMANVFMQQKKLVQASYFVEKAIEIYRKIPWLSRLKSSYFLLGEINFELENFSESEKYFAKYFNVDKEFEGRSENTYREGEIFFYLAKIARINHQKSNSDSLLEMAENLFFEYAVQLPEFNKNLVVLKLYRAEIADSENEALKNMDLARQLAENIPGLNFRIKLSEAIYFRRFNQRKKAVSIHDESKKQFEAGNLPADFEKLWLLEYCSFLNENFLDENNPAFMLEQLATLQHFFEKNNSSENNYALLRDYATSGKSIKILYDKILEVSSSLFFLTHNSEYLNLAFRYAEMFSHEEPANLNQNPNSFSGRKTIELAQIQNNINRLLTENSDSVDGQNQDLVELINQREILLQQFSEQKGHRLFHINELKNELDSEEIYLKFYETDSVLYRFAITPNNVELHQIRWSEKDRQKIEFVKKFAATPPMQITLSDVNRFARHSFEIYKLLLPVELPENLIVDWSTENAFPVEVLLTESHQSSTLNMKDFPFLMKSNVVRYAGSAGLFMHSLHINNSNYSENYIGFAPFSEKTFPGYEKLVYSGEEIENNARLINGKVLKNREATKKALLNNRGGFQILQLSTHADINAQHPQLGEICLLGEEKSGLDKLFFYEISNHTWLNNLVILSACRTGEGEHVVHFGTVSLSNAFQNSGAQGVVATKWMASDFVSAKITHAMLQNCKSGMESGEALQLAKLNFLQQASEIYSHPFYWATYSFQGPKQYLKFAAKSKFFTLQFGVFFSGFILLTYFLTKLVRKRKII